MMRRAQIAGPAALRHPARARRQPARRCCTPPAVPASSSGSPSSWSRMGALVAWYITADVRFVMLAGLAYSRRRARRLQQPAVVRAQRDDDRRDPGPARRRRQRGRGHHGRLRRADGLRHRPVDRLQPDPAGQAVRLAHQRQRRRRSATPASFTGVELLQDTGQLVLYGAPIAIVVLPALIFVGIARSNPLALWLGMLLGAAIVSPALSVALRPDRLADADAQRAADPALLGDRRDLAGPVRRRVQQHVVSAALIVAAAGQHPVDLPRDEDLPLPEPRADVRRRGLDARVPGGRDHARAASTVGIVDEQAMADYITDNITDRELDPHRQLADLRRDAADRPPRPVLRPGRQERRPVEGQRPRNPAPNVDYLLLSHRHGERPAQPALPGRRRRLRPAAAGRSTAPTATCWSACPPDFDPDDADRRDSASHRRRRASDRPEGATRSSRRRRVDDLLRARRRRPRRPGRLRQPAGRPAAGPGDAPPSAARTAVPSSRRAGAEAAVEPSRRRAASPRSSAEPEPEPRSRPVAPEPEPEPASKPVAAEPAEARRRGRAAEPRARAAGRAARKPAASPKPAPEPAPEPEAEPSSTAVPPIMPIARPRPVAAVARRPTPTPPRRSRPPRRRRRRCGSGRARTPTRHRPGADAGRGRRRPVARGLGYLGVTVQEVADAAIERLRDAENATLHHLARARGRGRPPRRAADRPGRARRRADPDHRAPRGARDHQPPPGSRPATRPRQTSRDGRQLGEISDAVSRFAESIESSLAPLRPTPTWTSHERPTPRTRAAARPGRARRPGAGRLRRRRRRRARARPTSRSWSTRTTPPTGVAGAGAPVLRRRLAVEHPHRRRRRSTPRSAADDQPGPRAGRRRSSARQRPASTRSAGSSTRASTSTPSGGRPPVVAGGKPTKLVCRQLVCGDGDKTTVLNIPTDVDPDPRYDGWFTVFDIEPAGRLRPVARAPRGRRHDLLQLHAQVGPQRPRLPGARRRSAPAAPGLPLFAGLIRPKRAAGRPDQPRARDQRARPAQSVFVQPASSTDGNGRVSSLPEGARIRLKANVRCRPRSTRSPASGSS